MFISQAFAQTATPAAGGGAGLEQFLPLVAVFVVFYFLILRPQQRKMKAHREMVSQLRRGDKVVTQGGMIGTVNKVVSDTEVVVEFAENVRIRVLRSAINEIVAKTEPVSGAKEAAKDDAKDSGEAKTEEAAAPAEEKSGLAKLFGKK